MPRTRLVALLLRATAVLNLVAALGCVAAPSLAARLLHGTTAPLGGIRMGRDSRRDLPRVRRPAAARACGQGMRGARTHLARAPLTIQLQP